MSSTPLYKSNLLYFKQKKKGKVVKVKLESTLKNVQHESGLARSVCRIRVICRECYSTLNQHKCSYIQIIHYSNLRFSRKLRLYQRNLNILTTLGAVIGHDSTMRLANVALIKVPMNNHVSLTSSQRMLPAVKVSRPHQSANIRTEAQPFLRIHSQSRVNGTARIIPYPNMINRIFDVGFCMFTLNFLLKKAGREYILAHRDLGEHQSKSNCLLPLVR